MFNNKIRFFKLNVLLIVLIVNIRIGFATDIIKIYDSEKLSLSARIKHALQFANSEYGQQKIWLIFSVNTTLMDRISQTSFCGFNQNNLSLAKMIYGENDNNKSENSRDELLEQAKFTLLEKFNSVNSESKSIHKVDKNKIVGEVAFILDISLESGRPCMYNIYSQEIQHDFQKEMRPIFWLGNVGRDNDCSWFIAEFSKTRYDKLQLEIIKILSTISSSNIVFKFYQSIIEANYSIPFKVEAIGNLSHFNSMEAIKLAAQLAICKNNILIRKKAIFALGQMQHPTAEKCISALAEKCNEVEIQKEAIFWLSQKGNSNTITTFRNIVNSNNSLDIKEYTVFAISQLPKTYSTPMLKQIAKTSPHSKLRKKAIFWLGKTSEQHMMDLLIDIIDAGT